MKLQTDIGSPEFLGATILSNGVNFALFSKHAIRVWLCLEYQKTITEIPLDSENHTGEIWHIFVKDLPLPCKYTYRVNGPKNKPHFYHEKTYLVDPYAKQLDTSEKWNQDIKYQPKAILQIEKNFDWQGVISPKHEKEDLIIYELHVRAFTQDPSSRVQHLGTYVGLIEKIPYLKKLGINAVELMPIHEFNESSYKKIDPVTNKRLCNFWGYSSVHFFSPMNRYATDFEKTIEEFKTLIREFHRNGIEVFLDVVFNHTSENDLENRYSFMGIDRSVYYLLQEDEHCNYTGCGHTMNLNHPMMQKLILDCLHYWVKEMHIDGFRFDLASTLHRDTKGKLGLGKIVEKISKDPNLQNTKLIAEPWDLDAFQLGNFYPKYWSEWNGQYRDHIRKFIRGDGDKKKFANGLMGSVDLFHQRSPQASINFITCHDGFTLRDLVSYDQKHNERNSEENQDGNSNNLSWNSGIEGDTKDCSILALRDRQMKNFILALFISQGVPMIFMGDEYGHTKEGNNNTWCQDNALNWFQWNQKSLFTEFITKVISFRKSHPILRQTNFIDRAQIHWHGKALNEPKWQEEKNILAFTLLDPKKNHLYIAFNATQDAVEFSIPKAEPTMHWYQVFNTSKSRDEKIQIQNKILLPSYSSLVLEQQFSR